MAPESDNADPDKFISEANGGEKLGDLTPPWEICVLKERGTQKSIASL